MVKNSDKVDTNTFKQSFTSVEDYSSVDELL